MNPFFVTDFSISDSLKTVRKSVLIYETIILVTEIRIDLVSHSYITNNELDFIQEIENSSNIKAINEVKDVVDEYTIYAKSSICDEPILIEFENKMMYKREDRVYIEGSLEIETPDLAS